MDQDATALFEDVRVSLRDLTKRFMDTSQSSGIAPTDFVAVIVPLYMTFALRIMLTMRATGCKMDQEYFKKLAGDIWVATMADIERERDQWLND